MSQSALGTFPLPTPTPPPTVTRPGEILSDITHQQVGFSLSFPIP